MIKYDCYYPNICFPICQVSNTLYSNVTVLYYRTLYNSIVLHSNLTFEIAIVIIIYCIFNLIIF